jgi:hypothetical protein
MMETNGQFEHPDRRGLLRMMLEEACASGSYSLSELTVLAAQNDPFRVDTPARHRDGEWLAMQADRLGLGDRIIHLRGLHYMLVSGEVTKADGKPYTNTDPDWTWLQGNAAKAARWLGYIPFQQIADHRNAEPVVRIFEYADPSPLLKAGVEIDIPTADQFEPRVEVDGFTGIQPFKLVMFGERASLEDILSPICERRQADLYLPTGEISDTLLYRMAATAAVDGRRMVVLTFSDCDPSGWQMPISIARKLQGLAPLVGGFAFEVRRVALSPDQVRQHGLPSTPLKETERRADRWQREMGTAQTEIDALAALQPDLLRRMANSAVRPFFDTSLERRVAEAKQDWLERARAAFDAQLDQEQLGRIRADMEAKLGDLRAEVDAINQALQVEVGEDAADALPPIVVPEADITVQADGLPLIDSTWDFAAQSRRLIDAKAYRS